MKNLKYILAVLVLSFIYNCSTDELINETPVEWIEQNNKSGSSAFVEANEKNSLIIRYDQMTTDFGKDALRSEYNVKLFKKCDCSDARIELWIFDTDEDDTSFIEEKKLLIDEEEDEEEEDDGIEGTHFNSDIKIDNSFNWSEMNDDVNDYIHKIVPENQNVTIAVLDTGINPSYSGFSKPFIYKNNDLNNCNQSDMLDHGGWDFINDDNIPFDDNSHGTIISYLINSKLNNNGIQHQILPVKVFDANGKGNLFNILCGFKYALSKPEVSIINLSFGSYKYRELFEMFINEAQNKVLVMCSAGNDESNNDSRPHFPSSYNAPNILAVGGLSDVQSGQNSLAWFSNFGTNSVDLAAQSYISVLNNNNEIISLFGTSYSCAFASAETAKLYYEGVMPVELKQMVINQSVYSPQLERVKYSAYID